MLLLALLLMSPPAGSADDDAPALHRCEATLTSPWGELDLSAWGSSEARAVAALEDEAALMAELQRGGARWAELFPLQGAGGAFMEDFTRAAAAPLFVPGASLGEASCSVEDVQLKGKKTWTATWRGGDPEAVSRAHPAHALEAARRRACLPPFQRAVRGAADQMAMAPQEGREGLFTDGWREATHALAECWTAAPPELGRGKKAKPSAPGLYTCDALQIAPRTKPTPIGQGWGRTPEGAAEHASRSATLQRYRAGLADAMEAHTLAGPETLSYLVNQGLRRALAGLGATSDALDRAELSCRVGALKAPAALAWTPTKPGVLRSCDVGDNPWPEPISEAAALPDTLDAACDHWPTEVFGMIAESAERAKQPPTPTDFEVTPEQRRTFVVRYQQNALSCSTSCRSESNLHIAWAPITLPGVPDRSSEEAVWALVDAAVKAKDGEALMMAIRDADAAQYLAQDPDGFWERVQEVHPSGALREAHAIVAHHGVHVAVPKGR